MHAFELEARRRHLHQDPPLPMIGYADGGAGYTYVKGSHEFTESAVLPCIAMLSIECRKHLYAYLVNPLRCSRSTRARANWSAVPRGPRKDQTKTWKGDGEGTGGSWCLACTPDTEGSVCHGPRWLVIREREKDAPCRRRCDACM